MVRRKENDLSSILQFYSSKIIYLKIFGQEKKRTISHQFYNFIFFLNNVVPTNVREENEQMWQVVARIVSRGPASVKGLIPCEDYFSPQNNRERRRKTAKGRAIVFLQSETERQVNTFANRRPRYRLLFLSSTSGLTGHWLAARHRSTCDRTSSRGLRSASSPLHRFNYYPMGSGPYRFVSSRSRE